MREILFRGKTRTGNWIEGFCFKKSCDVDYWCISKSPISANDYSEILGDYEEIIPETVGQFTGLKDKNGKKIFEGDIVYCKSRLDNANMAVIFECGQFRMILSENYRNYQTNSGFYDINCFDKEVIGNIHDNPELLKEG